MDRATSYGRPSNPPCRLTAIDSTRAPSASDSVLRQADQLVSSASEY